MRILTRYKGEGSSITSEFHAADRKGLLTGALETHSVPEVSQGASSKVAEVYVRVGVLIRNDKGMFFDLEDIDKDLMSKLRKLIN